MARPKKIGLDYFPMDVDMDQDDKIYLVKADYGWEGFSIVVKLLMDIYKESYYIEWDERKAKIFSRKNLFNLDTVNAVINLCLEEDMFDNNLFEKYSILTSKGIQTRYLEATTRRKNVLIYKEFLLIDIKDITNNNLTIVNVYINPHSIDENVCESTQSKVKESKVKERKEKEVVEEEPATTTPDAIIFYQNNFGVITPHVSQDMLAWVDDLGEEMVIEALTRALNRNKPNWGYAKSILQSWINKNIKTIEQAKAEEVDFQNQQASKRSYQPRQQENVPDWFKDRNKQSNKLPNQPEATEEDVAAILAKYKTTAGGS